MVRSQRPLGSTVTFGRSLTFSVLLSVICKIKCITPASQDAAEERIMVLAKDGMFSLLVDLGVEGADLE